MTITDVEATLASDGGRLLTIDAAADFLAISRGAVYNLLDRGETSSIHIGRSRRTWKRPRGFERVGSNGPVSCAVRTYNVPAQETSHTDTRITSHPDHRWIEV